MTKLRDSYMSEPTDRWHVARAVFIFAICLLFVGAYYQSPLFTSNQNTYFLHGLARAGFGHLSSDWLAQQVDHVPVFGAMVALVHKLDSHWLYYTIFGALVFIYAVSLLVITAGSSTTTFRTHHLLVFLSLLTLMHSTWMLNPVSRLLPNWSQSMILQVQRISHLSTNGLAGQYILGSYLQPSAFGVLLIASVALFVSKREFGSILCAVFAATINPTYILHTVVLTGAYIKILVSERSGQKATKIGVYSILLILPIVLYVILALNLTSDTVLSKAQTILVEERIPHHAKITEWFSNESYVQLAILLIGVKLSRNRNRLFHILLICSVVSIALTILQMLTSNMGLALLFPWRLSTWLVPICATAVLANISMTAANRIDAITHHRLRQIVRIFAVSMSVIFLLMACNLGLKNTVEDAIRKDRYEGTILSYAKIKSSSAQIYLIPLDLQDFRLVTGLPIFVDWKSTPYRPVDLVEWYERVQLSRAYYEASNSVDAISTLDAIRNHTRITHVIVEKESDVLHAAMVGDYEFGDNMHVVYKLRNN